MKIIVDYREKNSDIPYRLQSLGLEIEYRNLKVGDYIVGNIIVERKTAEDFVASIIDGRLSEQLFKMSASAELSYLVVVGFLSEAMMKHDINRKAVISALVSASLKRAPIGKSGVVVVNTVETSFDFAYFIERLAKRIEDGDVWRLPPIPKITTKGGEMDLMIAMLTAIPNVGVDKARRLLEHFGNIRSIANASIGELTSVKGIGIETAKNIYNFFNKPFFTYTTE